MVFSLANNHSSLSLSSSSDTSRPNRLGAWPAPGPPRAAGALQHTEAAPRSPGKWRLLWPSVHRSHLPPSAGHQPGALARSARPDLFSWGGGSMGCVRWVAAARFCCECPDTASQYLNPGWGGGWVTARCGCCWLLCEVCGARGFSALILTGSWKVGGFKHGGIE